MDKNQVIAALAAFALAIVGAVTVISVSDHETPTADAASSLGNLSTTLEALVDPIVNILVIVFVIGLIYGLFGRMKKFF